MAKMYGTGGQGLHPPRPPSRCTHHLCVGDFSQQLRQVVSTQPLVTVVELQATDGCSHAAGGDHGRRVHGQAVICQRESMNVQSVRQQLQATVATGNHDCSPIVKSCHT